MNNILVRLAPAAAAAAALALAGCASFSPDGGTGRVAELTKERAGQVPSYQRTSGEVDTAQADILGLLTLPVASQVEQRRFAQAQLQAAHEAVGVAADTRKAYFSAVAAQELVKYFSQVKEAADASNELARRMAQAGNFNKLAPKQPTEPENAEQTAMEKRLDVLMAKRAAEHTARSLGLTKATRFINVLELGYRNKSVTGEPSADGYEIELQLPLFDFGSTRAARAEATYMRAVHRTAQVAVEALRDYWVAETNLQTALTGRSPGSGGAPRSSASAAPGESGGGH